MTTRAGTECVACAFQALTEADPTATAMSLDGVSAFDLISRRAMLESLAAIPGESQVLPFVRMFYGSPSNYLREGDGGVRTIEQGRVRARGRHDATFVLPRPTCSPPRSPGRLEAGERLFAFWDDWVVTALDRVGPAYTAIREALREHSRIRVNQGLEFRRNPPSGMRHVGEDCSREQARHP